MGKYTKEQLEEKYKKLPVVLQDALYSTETASKLYNIGKKFGLTVEKIGFMAEETGYVILGLTRPEEFTGILKITVGLGDNQTKDMAADISREIFYSLRDVLKSAHSMDIAGSVAASAKEVPPFMRGMQQQETVSSGHNVIMPGGAATFTPPQNRVPTVDLRVPSEKVPAPAAPAPPVAKPASSAIVPPVSAIPKPPTPSVTPPVSPLPAPKSPEPFPISPPPPSAAKIPPIDLRLTKPPSTPRVEPAIKIQPPPNIPLTSPNTLVLEKKGTAPANIPSAPVNKPGVPAEKKIPDKGLDPYREPVE